MKFVSSLGAISGNIGSAMFSHNRAGTYVRLSRKPTKNNSSANTQSQYAFTKAAARWRLLPPETQKQYNVAAIELNKGTGYNLFQEGACNIVASGGKIATLTTPNAPPRTFNFYNLPVPEPIVTSNLNFSFSNLFGVDICPSDSGVIIECRVLSALSSDKQNKLKHLYSFAKNSFNAGVTDLLPAFIDMFGSQQSGQAVELYARCINQSSGESSAPFYQKTVIFP